MAREHEGIGLGWQLIAQPLPYRLKDRHVAGAARVRPARRPDGR